MIFSELYCVYYNTVAKILQDALDGNAARERIRAQIEEHAFSESAQVILPALET